MRPQRIDFGGQNPQIGDQKVDDCQTPQLSKKHMYDRTQGRGRSIMSVGMSHANLLI